MHVADGDNVLRLDIVDLSAYGQCTVITAADVGGLALSLGKSQWHGSLRSIRTCKSCTRGHVS